MNQRFYTDIHAHILYDLDDGPKDRATMVEMFRLAAGEGICRMVATPHFIAGANRYEPEQLQERLAEAKALLREEGLDLQLALGQELFLDEHLPGRLEDGEARSLAGTRYLLVEFPMTRIPANGERILEGLIHQGYCPVIAHPERCQQIQQDPDRLVPLIELGCLTQINAGSLTGRHGKIAGDTAMILLQANMVHLVATDCHTTKGRPPQLHQAFQLVTQTLGEVQACRIFHEHPEKLWTDQPIPIPVPHELPSRPPFWKMVRQLWGATS